ncbi:MAG TPA: alpha/beta hydrolase, partial [Blastocatellia bacterium]|nr:alpha/beta hydrolase [Blastocatellia bacterium]
MQSTPRDGRVKVNGLDLHYLSWPCPRDGTGVCLLLHGSTGNAYVWNRVAPEISKHMLVIAPDLRGHGESEWANPPAYRCEDFAADIASLIDSLSLDPVSIVAHSMSVFHTLRHAATRPSGLDKLVLVDIEPTGRAEHREILRGAGRKPERRFRSVAEAVERERRI